MYESFCRSLNFSRTRCHKQAEDIGAPTAEICIFQFQASRMQVLAQPSQPFRHSDDSRRRSLPEEFAGTKQESLIISREIAYQLVYDCTKRHDLELARRVQSFMIHSGLDSVTVLVDHLIRLFAACNNWVEANYLFHKVPLASHYTWNAIIDTHAKLGEGGMALHLYDSLLVAGAKPNKYTFPSILKACGAVGAKAQGICIHEQIIGSRLQLDTVVGSALLDMYAKCGNLRQARQIFQKLPNRNVISWNSMIAGYFQHQEPMLAIECFYNMEKEGIKPSKVTFLNVLRGCSILGNIHQGRQIHEGVMQIGFQFDIMVGNTLVDMYAKCSSLEEAHRLFCRLPSRNVVTWGAIITGYAQHGEGLLALECFNMMDEDGIKASILTYPSILKACGNGGTIEQGRRIHVEILERGFQSDVMVGSGIVDMYAKCGSLKDAWIVFEQLSNKNVVTWGAMIAGIGHAGEVSLVVQCFEKMQATGIRPDDIVFSGILTAVSRAGLVDEGLLYFKIMREHNAIKPNMLHITCMLDLVGRAGYFREAQHLLNDSADIPDICVWMTLLSACRIHGNIEVGRRCFDEALSLDPQFTAAYLLMSCIYASASMDEIAYSIEDMGKCAGALKYPTKMDIEGIAWMF